MVKSFCLLFAVFLIHVQIVNAVDWDVRMGEDLRGGGYNSWEKSSASEPVEKQTKVSAHKKIPPVFGEEKPKESLKKKTVEKTESADRSYKKSLEAKDTESWYKKSPKDWGFFKKK